MFGVFDQLLTRYPFLSFVGTFGFHFNKIRPLPPFNSPVDLNILIVLKNFETVVVEHMNSAVEINNIIAVPQSFEPHFIPSVGKINFISSAFLCSLSTNFLKKFRTSILSTSHRSSSEQKRFYLYRTITKCLVIKTKLVQLFLKRTLIKSNFITLLLESYRIVREVHLGKIFGRM